MPEIQMINEKPVTIYEVKDKLADIKKRDKELSFRAKKTEEFINNVSLMKEKKSKELLEDLEKNNADKLKLRHLVKIVDILPKDVESLKILFVNEPVALKQEDFEKLIEIVKKYA